MLVFGGQDETGNPHPHPHPNPNPNPNPNPDPNPNPNPNPKQVNGTTAADAPFGVATVAAIHIDVY